MRPVKARGRRQAVLARLGSIAGLGACALVAWAGVASAAPTDLTFFPAQVPVVFHATGSGGTTDVTVLVAISELVPADQLSALPFPAPPAGETYFEVKLQPADPAAGAPFVPLSIPKDNATLETSAGSVAAVGLDPSAGSLDADWYFPVPDSITQATLTVAAATVTSYGSDGSQESFALAPATIDFTTKGPATVPVPVSGNSGTGATSPAVTATGGASGSGVAPGVVIGGVFLLGIGAAAAVTIGRRRAFYRADREGRVVLVGPPSLSAAALAARLGTPGGAVGTGERERHGIVVKLLGWLEIEGTKQPVTAGPLLELICYLVLNPGRSFTSVQIRESVWGLGRQPITSGAFRNYMVALRKAFGPGVVVTERFRYQLTDAVISDWDLFQAALEAEDRLTGAEQALALVRGPVLHGSFDGKKNSPFAWAVGIANDIEGRITATAAEVAHVCMDRGDAQRASRAIELGLRCAESDLALRRLDLEAGAAEGGTKELARRLEAARASMEGTFPGDVEGLEAVARELGWEVGAPG